MNRRTALAWIVALGLPGVEAQGRTPTVGVLWIEAGKPSPQLAALVEGLRAHGYAPGRNIHIDDQSLVDGYDGLARAASRLVAAKVDIIVAYGTTAVLAAHQATTTIPIVMVSAGSPDKFGLAKSLSRPGGNVTGLTNITNDLAAKRLELLRDAFPAIRRVAVVLYPGSTSEMQSLRNYEAAARGLGVETRTVEIRDASQIMTTLGAVSSKDADAIAFVGSTLFRANATQVVNAVRRTRLPAIYVEVLFAERGGLFSYGPNTLDQFRRAAGYVDKILKGAKAGELAIEQPTRLELVINAGAAKAQGHSFPRAFVLRADRVIE